MAKKKGQTNVNEQTTEQTEQTEQGKARAPRLNVKVKLTSEDSQVLKHLGRESNARVSDILLFAFEELLLNSYDMPSLIRRINEAKGMKASEKEVPDFMTAYTERLKATRNGHTEQEQEQTEQI